MTASLECMFWWHASFRLTGCHVNLFGYVALCLHRHNLEGSQNLPDGLHV